MINILIILVLTTKKNNLIIKNISHEQMSYININSFAFSSHTTFFPYNLSTFNLVIPPKQRLNIFVRIPGSKGISRITCGVQIKDVPIK